LSVYYENYIMRYFVTSQWILSLYIIALFVCKLCYFVLLYRLFVDFITQYCCVTCLSIMLMCVKLHKPDQTLWSRTELQFADVNGSTSRPLVKVTTIYSLSPEFR
jgi:hypothetical protein